MTDTCQLTTSASLTTALALMLAAVAPSAMATTVNATGMLPGEPYLMPLTGQYASYPPVSIGPGFVADSQSALTFSGDTLAALDTAKVAISSARATSITKDADGYYTGASFNSSSAYDSVALDDVTHELKGVTMATDITMTAPYTKKVADGGTLAIHGLTISPTDHLIYATLNGGPVASVPMFTYNNTDLQITKGPDPGVPSGSSCYPIPSGCDMMPYLGLQQIDFKLSNASLHLTQQGMDAMTQSLGLVSLGQQALSGVSDFGTLSMNTTVYALPNYFTPSVPEPTSFVLMGLGLIGLFGVSRRKAH